MYRCLHISLCFKATLSRIFRSLLPLCLSGCLYLPEKLNYSGPPLRPNWIYEYYAITDTYTKVQEEPRKTYATFTTKQIKLDTAHLGQITIDYYQQATANDTLILVFPILGGKQYSFEKYFAQYFAEHGFDTAIVHRNDAFKDPSQSDNIEKVFRLNVIRDRIALNFFEDIYHKTTFGTFGLSRGGINVAITAGVDERLKYNVMIMAGSDLVGIFKHSEQKGVKKYRDRVLSAKGITKEELYTFFRSTIKTDPKSLAPYIDARNTLMLLCLFDRTVPIKYGLELRKKIGNPNTIFLLSDHYTSLLYTQYFPLLPPNRYFSIFPVDYVENEALTFYRQSLEKKKMSFQSLIFSALRMPVEIVQNIRCSLQRKCRDNYRARNKIHPLQL